MVTFVGKSAWLCKMTNEMHGGSNTWMENERVP